MTIQDIVCFLKVAETLNYTKAAEQLYISQPAVTRHISTMEQEAGCRLLDRSVRRSVQLTDAGKILFDSLKQCRDIYYNAMNQIKVLSENSLVVINLMRGSTYPDRFIQATKQFMETHENFRHFTNFIEYDQFHNVIDRGEILLCSKEVLPTVKSYQYMKLTRTPVSYYIIASKWHSAFADGQEVNLNELAKTTLFLPEKLPRSMKDLVENTVVQLFGAPPKEVLYLDSSDSVSLFLRSNECFTISTGWNNNIRSNDFRVIPLPLFTDYYAVWNPELLRNSDALAYLEALRESIS